MKRQSVSSSHNLHVQKIFLIYILLIPSPYNYNLLFKICREKNYKQQHIKTSHSDIHIYIKHTHTDIHKEVLNKHTHTQTLREVETDTLYLSIYPSLFLSSPFFHLPVYGHCIHSISLTCFIMVVVYICS